LFVFILFQVNPLQADEIMAKHRIYFTAPDAPTQPVPVLFFSFQTRGVRQIGVIEKEIEPGPSFFVGQDGRWIMWAQVDRKEADLMMVENFR